MADQSALSLVTGAKEAVHTGAENARDALDRQTDELSYALNKRQIVSTRYLAIFRNAKKLFYVQVGDGISPIVFAQFHFLGRSNQPETNFSGCDLSG